MIESDKLPVDTPDSMGLTALHYAVIKNRTACVRTLLDAGADVNRQDLTGKTPGFYGKFCFIVLLASNLAIKYSDISCENTNDFKLCFKLCDRKKQKGA